MNDGTRTRSGLPVAASKSWRHDGADIAERRRRVFNLKKLRWSFRRIAAELDVSVATVHADYRQALDELLPVEEVDEMRRADIDLLETQLQIEVHRLRAATEGPMPETEAELAILLSIDVEKVQLTILRIQERRARLAGLDRPVETTVEHRIVIAAPEQVTSLRDDLAGRREDRERRAG